MIPRLDQLFLGPDDALTVEERVVRYLDGMKCTAIHLDGDGNMTREDELRFLAGLRSAFQRELPEGLRAVFDLPTRTIHLEQHGRVVGLLGFDETHILVAPRRSAEAEAGKP